MHPAPAFLETDQQTLLNRVRDWPFAIVIGIQNERAHVAHAPVIADKDGDLQFHLAKSNPASQAIVASGHALIVFTGPHDYISPDWYGLDAQVPTWNYLSVEAEGPVRQHTPAEARRALDDLAVAFEHSLAPKDAWSLAQMDAKTLDRMVSAIEAFSLQPERFEGITKIGQYNPDDARIRAGKALKASGGNTILAAMMERE